MKSNSREKQFSRDPWLTFQIQIGIKKSLLYRNQMYLNQLFILYF